MQGGGDFVTENLDELQVGLAKSVRLGAFDIERADDFVLKDQRHRQRATGARSAGKIERIGGSIGTKIAFASGSNVAGNALAFTAGQKDTVGGLRRHAFLHQRFEPAGLWVEQTNFDHFIMEQITGETADIKLEQLDAFRDAHVGKLIGRQCRQFSAGFVQGVEFLLLLDQGGNIAAKDKKKRFRTIRLANGLNVQIDNASLAATQANRLIAVLRPIQGGTEGTKLRANDVR